MDQDPAGDVRVGNAFELFNFHVDPLFGQRAAEQVDLGIGQIWLGLELVRSFQQQGAQVAGVFEVVGLQLEVAAQGVRHDALVVRASTDGSVQGRV